MAACTISRVDTTSSEELRGAPSNDAPAPSSRPDIIAMIGIQVAQALISAFHASNATEPPAAPPSPCPDLSDPRVTAVCADQPTLVSLYRKWYGSHQVVRLGSRRARK